MAYEISSDSKGIGYNLSRSRGGKNVGHPKKVKKMKGSLKLALGPCPSSEDYSRLSIWTNEEIRKNTLGWLDESNELGGRAGTCKVLCRGKCVLGYYLRGRQ